MAKATSRQQHGPRPGPTSSQVPAGITGGTVEEWKSRRDAAYDELSKDPSIPPNLISAVKDFRANAAVIWVTKEGKPVGRNDAHGIPIVEPKQRSNKESWSGSSEHQVETDISLPQTAGEALAMCLRARLAALHEAGQAPVRLGGMLSRSAIATVAADMLPPNTQVTDLIVELLEVNRRKLTGDRLFDARQEATWIMAQIENIGTRELAKMIDVNASTVSRWVKESDFRGEIEARKRFIETAKKEGIWPIKNETVRALATELEGCLIELGKYLDSKEIRVQSRLAMRTAKKLKATSKLLLDWKKKYF